MTRTIASNRHSTMTLMLLGCYLMVNTAYAQVVSIDSAYNWAEENYPLIKKANLIKQTETYSIANIAKDI